MSRNVHDEIERKFLVRSIPDLEAWPGIFADVHIHQIYMRRDDGVAERFRRTRAYDLVRYTHCMKTYKGPGINEEDERQISLETFRTQVDQRKHEISGSISKRRRLFQENGLTFELDIFSTPGRLLLLEVELDSLEQDLLLPDFIEIEREVTDDKRYSNAWIAAHGLPTIEDLFAAAQHDTMFSSNPWAKQ